MYKNMKNMTKILMTCMYRRFVLENYSEFKIKTDRSHRRLQTWENGIISRTKYWHYIKLIRILIIIS